MGVVIKIVFGLVFYGNIGGVNVSLFKVMLIKLDLNMIIKKVCLNEN